MTPSYETVYISFFTLRIILLGLLLYARVYLTDNEVQETIFAGFLWAYYLHFGTYLPNATTYHETLSLAAIAWLVLTTAILKELKDERERNLSRLEQLPKTE